MYRRRLYAIRWSRWQLIKRKKRWFDVEDERCRWRRCCWMIGRKKRCAKIRRTCPKSSEMRHQHLRHGCLAQIGPRAPPSPSPQGVQQVFPKYLVIISRAIPSIRVNRPCGDLGSSVPYYCTEYGLYCTTTASSVAVLYVCL